MSAQDPASTLSIIASGFGFPEGPVVDADGSIVITEIRNQRCTRIMPDGKSELFSDCGGGPNGLAIGPDGAFYLCNNGGSLYLEGVSISQGPHPDYAGGSVQRIDPKSGHCETLYSHCDGHKLSAPNDLVFDEHGGFYFTDMGKRYPRHRDHGGVYYARADGSEIKALAYPMLSPNGCGLSPDGKTLYAADTENAWLWAFEIVAPGEFAPPPRFHPHCGVILAGLPGPARFDSLAVLANGNIAVATLQTGFITEFTAEGDIARAVKVPDIYPTNICFGGEDRCTAYITLSDQGHLASMRWPEPGLPLVYG